FYGAALTASSPSAALRFANDLGTLAIAREDGGVDLVDVASGVAKKTIASGYTPCGIEAWSDDGATLVLGQVNRRASLFDVATGKRGGDVAFPADRYDKIALESV